MAKTNQDKDDRKTAQGESRRSGLGDNPVAALAGGFAVGAVVGVIIPAGRREREALQPLGAKMSEGAQAAARNVAQTGRDKLNRLTGEVVTQVGSKVIDAVAPSQDQSASA